MILDDDLGKYAIDHNEAIHLINKRYYLSFPINGISEARGVAS